tara:strand:- start:2234 stop:3955 length:1722 start_codon:yes stop_codon:yes gene_type:complete
VKEIIKKIIIDTATSCLKNFDVCSKDFNIEIPKGKGFGDFSTNLAMVYANKNRHSPLDVAGQLAEDLRKNTIFSKVDIAGPGFINIIVNTQFISDFVGKVLEEGTEFGSKKIKKSLKVILEFVSANPTGPIHVGHGRGAVIGSSLAKIFAFQNYNVHTEYYVNDSGRQMDILALSVIQRFNNRNNTKNSKIVGIYEGGYVDQILDEYVRAYNFKSTFELISASDCVDNEDTEKIINKLIDEAKAHLGEEFNRIREFSCAFIMRQIKNVLAEFRVNFDSFYSEQSLYNNKLVQNVINKLIKKGIAYKKDGAVWFSSTKYNDEKDRVLVRRDGSPTYFASDIAYHEIKLKSNNDILINIWGADHHGYIPRLKGAISSLGYHSDSLVVVLVQFASLIVNKKKVSMSTRKGLFKTLEDLIKEVGVDATRFFYLMRKADQTLEFDIDLAKEETSKNPVYYIQYAHARLSSVIRQSNISEEEIINFKGESLYDESERNLVFQIGNFPEIVKNAEIHRDPSIIAQYLREFANSVHHNYVVNKILVDDISIRSSRLRLAKASRFVLANGLGLLGISCPEQM